MNQQTILKTIPGDRMAVRLVAYGAPMHGTYSSYCVQYEFADNVWKNAQRRDGAFLFPWYDEKNARAFLRRVHARNN